MFVTLARKMANRNAKDNTKSKDAVVDRMYRQTLEVAPRSGENIALLARTCGVGHVADPAFNEEGLAEVERVYRRLCSTGGFTADMDRDMFEELMTYFLGETLIDGQQAEWYAYKGKFYTIKPVLIRFPNRGKAIDISAVLQKPD